MNLLYNVKFLSEWGCSVLNSHQHCIKSSFSHNFTSFKFLPSWDVRNFISFRLKFAILSVFVYLLFCFVLFSDLYKQGFDLLWYFLKKYIKYFSENNQVLFTQSFLQGPLQDSNTKGNIFCNML